jgi:hypothetical protein
VGKAHCMDRGSSVDRFKLWVGITGMPAASADDVLKEAQGSVRQGIARALPPEGLDAGRSVVFGRAVRDPDKAELAIAFAGRRVQRCRWWFISLAFGIYLTIEGTGTNRVSMWLGIGFIVGSVYLFSVWVRALRSISSNRAIMRHDPSG